ncbi:MAG: TetR/AcrR family transcriptional regulator [Candidatus Limnocylindrales bacterium]
MTTKTRGRPRRQTLSRERVLEAAVAFADERGLEELSMRKLGQSLGVEAMSLYNHVADKDDLLDGIVDIVARELEPPDPELDWRAALRRCSMRSREVLLRHPWSAALAESRAQSGPARLGYLEALLEMLRGAGFSPSGAYRVNLFVDSYVYGFVLQEVAWPTESDESFDPAQDFAQRTASERFPRLVEVARVVADGDWDPAADFERGLDLILDGVETMLEADRSAG